MQSISSLDPFHWVIFLFRTMSFPLLPSSLAFHFGDHPRLHLSRGRHSLVCLCISASGALWWDCWAEGFNISQHPPPPPLPLLICPDLSLFISAMGSQLLMKSQSVLWTVTWSWVKRILASCSCFSVMSFNFQFTGVDGAEGGEGRLSLFLVFFVSSYLKLYDLCGLFL